MISQLTVFLENEKGRLAAACRAVSDAGINMHALNLADTSDFGVVRMLTDTPEAAAEALREQGYRATVTPVLAVRVPNVPGGLAKLLEFMDEQDANVEYGYCFSVNEDYAVDVLKAAAWTVPAFADVRKADVVYGPTVDARGLAVAQCPSIDAEYAMVMGADGTVYFERNAQSPTQIASITKIMTGVVALDAVEDGLLSLDSPVTVSAAAAAVGESSAGLQEGDVMNLDAALKALLVPSGNDAAVRSGSRVRERHERQGSGAGLHRHGVRQPARA